MATLLRTFTGTATYSSSRNYSVQARALLYKDSDTGSGYKMHWVWQLYIPHWVELGFDLYLTYPGGSKKAHIPYKSGYTYSNYVLTSQTGSQFTVAYSSSCSTSTTSYWTSDGGTKYQSSLSSSQTTYTVPKPTYTISYNANGGSGAPGNQTKTYGTNLTLSSASPSRTDYDFVGWGTSSTATTAAYQPGATYTENKAATLYAIWNLNYIHPAVQGLIVDRCDSTGELADDGTYVRAYFGYAADRTFDATNVITTVAATVNGVTETQTLNQQSGSATLIINANISETSAYTVTVTVTDSYKSGTATATGRIEIPQYLIDVNPNGGIGFGMPADEAGVIKTDMPMKIDNQCIQILDRNFPNAVPSSNYYGLNNGQHILFKPVQDEENVIGYIHLYHLNNGQKGLEVGVRRTVSNTDRYATMQIGVSPSGQLHVNSPAAFVRKAANASKTIGTGGIDSYVVGPTLSLESGYWIVNGTVNFNTGASSGSRNIQARFRVNGSLHSEGIRVFAAGNNFATLNISDLVNVPHESTFLVELLGSSSMAYKTATTWYLNAQKIGG